MDGAVKIALTLCVLGVIGLILTIIADQVFDGDTEKGWFKWSFLFSQGALGMGLIGLALGLIISLWQ